MQLKTRDKSNSIKTSINNEDNTLNLQSAYFTAAVERKLH